MSSPPRAAAATTAAAAPPLEDDGKVVVLFRATGDAPLLKRAKFKIAGAERFAKVVDFLRRQIHKDSVFVYLHSAFAPSLDARVSSLYSSYSVENMLVVHYACKPAWG